MHLTRDVVHAEAAKYADRQPLAAVEEEHLDLLPADLERGEFGWRDAEWIVQWHFRRHLGAYPDRKRRSVESAYGENDYEAVVDAVTAAAAADDTAEKLAHLTDLNGVDVAVGSAFLTFLAPERYLVVSPREWSVLERAEELSDPYPESPSPDDYERYLATCREVAERSDCDLRTLYKAIWVVSEDEPRWTDG